jgi:GDPmannose 4,6-dehydratase
MRPSALITGISGQDGSLLAEYLLKKGYKVHGLIRPSSHTRNLDHLLKDPNLHVIWGDLINSDLLRHILCSNKIDEVYNLASQSNIRLSYNNPELTFKVTLLGTISLIEAIKNYSPGTKIFQAGSSAMFGASCDDDGFQREDTPFKPISPYASSKLFAHNISQNYRNNNGIYISNGILYNHESSKVKSNPGLISTIVDVAIRISERKQESFFIPDINIAIDWGHAVDFIDAMWITLQQESSDDYIIATGEVHRISDVCKIVFSKLGLDWGAHIETDLGTNDSFISKGDPAKIKKIGWEQTHTFSEMIDEMIENRIKINNE